MAKYNADETGVTEQQKMFADFYLLTMNVKQSAIKAGYSEKSAASQGSDLLNNPKVIAYMEKRRKSPEQLLGINFFTQVQDIHRIAQKAEAKEAVKQYNPKTKEFEEVKDKDGNTVYQFDSHGAVKARELMNKMLGYDSAVKLANKDGGDLFENLKEIKVKIEDGTAD
jgi:phage terminase small subunit